MHPSLTPISLRPRLAAFHLASINPARSRISHSSILLSLFGPRYLHPLLSISLSSSLHISLFLSSLPLWPAFHLSQFHPLSLTPFTPPSPPSLPFTTSLSPPSSFTLSLDPLSTPHPPPPPPTPPTLSALPTPVLLFLLLFSVLRSIPPPAPLLLPFSPAILQASGARLQAFRESLDLLGSG